MSRDQTDSKGAAPRGAAPSVERDVVLAPGPRIVHAEAVQMLDLSIAAGAANVRNQGAVED